MTKAWGGYREGAGRKSTGRSRRYFYLTDNEAEQVKQLINIIREDDNMTQSKYYEQVGDNLKGDDAVRAYRAAQNHVKSESDTYMDDIKRLQDKIIKALDDK